MRLDVRVLIRQNDQQNCHIKKKKIVLKQGYVNQIQKQFFWEFEQVFFRYVGPVPKKKDMYKLYS